MRALLRAGVALTFGLVVGALAMLGLQQAPAGPSPSDPTRSAAPVKAAPVPEPEERVLLVWTPGGLPPGLAEVVASLPRIDAVTVVHAGLAELAAALPGFVIPLDVMGFDPATYEAFVPKSAAADFAELREGEALLGSTAAALRGVGRGAVLTLADGTGLVVAGVVDDTLVGAAEVAVGAATLPRLAPRYLLLRYRGERAAIEEAIRSVAPPGAPLRVRGPGETPYLRHGDAVLPQSIVKERFGEFAYRPGSGREFTQDPAWAREHIVTEEVPLLGRISCHRAVIGAVRGALEELATRGLGWLVEPDGYAGCYNPRLVSGLDGVSRHAWGIALDINEHKNPYGQASAQDPRLVEVFERWGFAWGGEWLIPDPAHFELVG